MSLLNGLAGYWTLAEASGNRADSSGHGLTLTDQNGNVGQTTGLLTGAAVFTGTASQVLKNTATQTLPTGPCAISGWVKLTNLTSNAYLFAEFVTTRQHPALKVIATTGVVAAGVTTNGGGAGDATGGALTADGFFHHLLLSYDGSGNLTLWVDGSSVGTATGLTAAMGGTLVVGNLSTSGISANAAFCELGIWTRALSSAEVGSLYNGGAGLAFASFAGSAGSPIHAVGSGRRVGGAILRRRIGRRL